MSIWTHVTGVVKFRCFENKLSVDTLDYIFGKECTWGSSSETKVDANANPELYMPKGSESSLKRYLFYGPATGTAVVSIFGDLRDYSKPGDVIKWLQNVIKKIDKKYIMQQATMVVRCDLDEYPLVYGYNRGDIGVVTVT